MLFNSIFRNIKVTLLCITNTPTILYAACPEKWRGGGGGLGTWPPLSEFSGSAPAHEYSFQPCSEMRNRKGRHFSFLFRRAQGKWKKVSPYCGKWRLGRFVHAMIHLLMQTFACPTQWFELQWIASFWFSEVFVTGFLVEISELINENVLDVAYSMVHS